MAIAIPTFSNHHPDQSAATNVKARPSTGNRIITELSDDGEHFLVIKYF